MRLGRDGYQKSRNSKRIERELQIAFTVLTVEEGEMILRHRWPFVGVDVSFAGGSLSGFN